MKYERRQFPRVAIAHLVYCEYGAPDWPTAAEMTRTLDLSLTGLAVESRLAPELGEPVRLSLSMQNELTSVLAVVVRRAPLAGDLWDLGLDFTDTPRRYRELLALSFADAA